ncbi:DNA-directed RNA polymerase II subunit RPB1-like [Pollicipes pollicipes]|uniref:DNA-directed RNA polymerase II subunit RPB1-like n=1 Tax=Pollicipes pollicipes TaxID=41117 RepID=UPI001885013B|nr:DNA-directed RNA polymerase II subunit RPB1-like [Pollicipes pollicipes]
MFSKLFVVGLLATACLAAEEKKATEDLKTDSSSTSFSHSSLGSVHHSSGPSYHAEPAYSPSSSYHGAAPSYAPVSPYHSPASYASEGYAAPHQSSYRPSYQPVQTYHQSAYASARPSYGSGYAPAAGYGHAAGYQGVTYAGHDQGYGHGNAYSPRPHAAGYSYQPRSYGYQQSGHGYQPAGYDRTPYGGHGGYTAPAYGQSGLS